MTGLKIHEWFFIIVFSCLLFFIAGFVLIQRLHDHEKVEKPSEYLKIFVCGGVVREGWITAYKGQSLGEVLENFLLKEDANLDEIDFSQRILESTCVLIVPIKDRIIACIVSDESAVKVYSLVRGSTFKDLKEVVEKDSPLIAKKLQKKKRRLGSSEVIDFRSHCKNNKPKEFKT